MNCERTMASAWFAERLARQVMAQPAYADARRVFWIVDNGSAHRGKRAVARLREMYARLVLVNGPVHASWLNQIEIYFSIVQRKVLTPNDFPALAAVAERRRAFERYYETLAKSFKLTFARRDLAALFRKLSSNPLTSLRLAA